MKTKVNIILVSDSAIAITLKEMSIVKGGKCQPWPAFCYYVSAGPTKSAVLLEWFWRF